MDTLYGFLHTGFSTVVPFVLMLGILIFVHELGHFAVAKFCGVRVEIFSLGFGKKIFQFKRGDTTYCLSLIPLGGYVKMFGDEVGGQIPEDQKKYSFTHKTVGQRIAVVLAGPLMNFFFAILVFFVVASIGEELRAPFVGDVPAGTAAYNDGFRSGDKIISVESKPIQSWDDFQSLVSKNHDKKISIEVLREANHQKYEITSVPKLKPNPNVLSLDDYIGDIEGLSHLSKAATVGVKAKTLAEEIGIKTGDRIVSINDKPVAHFRDLEPQMLALQGQNISMTIERQDGKAAITKKINVQLPNFSSLGVFGLESSELYMAKVLETAPAFKSGLRDGDRIVKINEKIATRWEDILETVKSYSGQGILAIDVDRSGTPLHFEVQPEMTAQMNMQGGEEKRYTIGIMPIIMIAATETVTIQYKNLGASLVRGAERTWDVTVMTVVSFLRLIQSKISPKNIGGVISIGQAASETFKMGLIHFLQMMAILSVNLFILNLLPIPVLDGGHLLFYCIEALRGAPVSMRKMEIAQQVGLVVLMSLMVFALFNDFSRLFGFW